ncbi:hypothetical protein GCM10010279_65110 [Streptomyces mutabilis]|nr:hypothetical protein GCM10010279_65110 [Streptomyces mutabilis]
MPGVSVAEGAGGRPGVVVSVMAGSFGVWTERSWGRPSGMGTGRAGPAPRNDHAGGWIPARAALAPHRPGRAAPVSSQSHGLVADGLEQVRLVQ